MRYSLLCDGDRLFVKGRGVVLNMTKVVVVQAMNVCIRIPSASRRQLISFKQNKLVPAELGEMVENGTPHRQ